MQYSPKLKRAINQIKKIMNDNDLAGFAVIHTPGHSEFLMELTPSYSCIKWMPRMEGVNIQGKLSHYNGDITKRNKKLVDTCNMLMHLSSITMKQGLQMAEISKIADTTFHAEHGTGGLTSNQEQNN